MNLYKILIFILLFNLNCFAQSIKLDSVYQSAINYILNSDEFIEIYGKDNVSICVSEYLTTQFLNHFTDEIIKTEFDSLSTFQKDSIRSSIYKSYKQFGKLTYSKDSLLLKFANCYSTEKIVYFSIYEQSKLFAIVLKNNPNIKEYRELLLENAVVIYYLFYIDNEFKFVKTFTKIGYK